MHQNLYYEFCREKEMVFYPDFFQRLSLLEKCLTTRLEKDFKMSHLINCSRKKYAVYQLSSFVWPEGIRHYIKKHQSYPSHPFVQMIMHTACHQKFVCNPPSFVDPQKIDKIKYILLSANNILILDSLMKEGSHPRYIYEDKYIYSEHSGVLVMKNNKIESVIVSTLTNRIDPADTEIYLPINITEFENYPFLFHTHPNQGHYGGRISNGILYEFPSASDIYNFIKYGSTGKAQSSLIIAPEGLYNIKILSLLSPVPDAHWFDELKNFILHLEKTALKKNKKFLNQLGNADIFHQKIGADTTYITEYNKFLRPKNLIIEYYPRQKVNGEWILPSIYLQYFEEAD